MHKVIKEKQFLAMLDSHKGILYKVCRGYCPTKEDQADLYQEMAYQLWKSWPKYDPEKHSVTWVYRIALNTAISHYRRSSKKPIQEDLRNHSEPYHSDPQNTELLDRLYAAVHILNKTDKAIALLFLEGYNQKEIATISGFTATNVSTRMHRIKKKLKELILSFDTK